METSPERPPSIAALRCLDKLRAQMIDFLFGSARGGIKAPKKQQHEPDRHKLTFSAPSYNCTAIETYIGHPYSPAMYQPAALHEEVADRGQSVASPS